MQYVDLGKGGRKVSRLCFGTLTMAPMQKNLAPKEGAYLIEHAFDLGVNFLDTAEIYENYPHVALALKANKDAVVSTKCYAYDKETAQQSFEKAIKGIGRDYIDIFMLHEQESELTLKGHQKAIDFFLEKKLQGYIGQLGVSTHFIACVLAAANHESLSVIHPLFNKMGIGIADGSQAEMEKAICYAKQMGKGIFAMKPLGGGHLIKERTSALNYILGNHDIDSIAMGMQSIAEVDYNCALFNGQDPEIYSGLIKEQQRQILITDFCQGCGACAKRCSSGALKIEAGRAVVDKSKCVLCSYCASACPYFSIKVV